MDNRTKCDLTTAKPLSVSTVFTASKLTSVTTSQHAAKPASITKKGGGSISKLPKSLPKAPDFGSLEQIVQLQITAAFITVNLLDCLQDAVLQLLNHATSRMQLKGKQLPSDRPLYIIASYINNDNGELWTPEVYDSSLGDFDYTAKVRGIDATKLIILDDATSDKVSEEDIKKFKASLTSSLDTMSAMTKRSGINGGPDQIWTYVMNFCRGVCPEALFMAYLAKIDGILVSGMTCKNIYAMSTSIASKGKKKKKAQLNNQKTSQDNQEQIT